MMREAILNFPKQFKFRPKIVGPRPIPARPAGGRLGRKGGKFIVAGMGGSHLAAGILKMLKPELDIVIWRNYGLPFDLSSTPSSSPPYQGGEKGMQGRRGKTLVIASSYSGNTEETISAFEEARKRGLPLVAIAVGGKLIELAKQHNVPYVQLPDTGIQPRSALGFSLMAMLKVMKQSEFLKEAKELAKSPFLQFPPSTRGGGLEEQGRALAEKLRGKVPVIYASQRNESIAYNWKIKFNETGKIPAFYNTFPELNHNEMTGFDARDASRPLSEKFYFIMLKDERDHPQVQKRLEVTAKLYQGRGLSVEILPLQGPSLMAAIFSSLILADWTAFYTAEGYGLESEQVPMVEEFKKLIA